MMPRIVPIRNTADRERFMLISTTAHFRSVHINEDIGAAFMESLQLTFTQPTQRTGRLVYWAQRTYKPWATRVMAAAPHGAVTPGTIRPLGTRNAAENHSNGDEGGRRSR